MVTGNVIQPSSPPFNILAHHSRQYGCLLSKFQAKLADVLLSKFQAKHSHTWNRLSVGQNRSFFLKLCPQPPFQSRRVRQGLTCSLYCANNRYFFKLHNIHAPYQILTGFCIEFNLIFCHFPLAHYFPVTLVFFRSKHDKLFCFRVFDWNILSFILFQANSYSSVSLSIDITSSERLSLIPS